MSHDPHSLETSQDAAPTGRHPLEIGYLVMGIAFLGLAATWALVAGGAVSDGNVRWLLPVPWLAAGAAGIAATVRRRRPDRPTTDGDRA